MGPTQLKQAIYCHVSPSDESPKTQLLLLEVSLLLNGSGRWTRRKVSLTQAKAQTSTPPLPMHEWLQHTRRIRNLCGQRQRTLCGGGLRDETASSLASGCLRGGTRPHANVASDNSPSMAAIDDAGCLSDERGIIMIDDRIAPETASLPRMTRILLHSRARQADWRALGSPERPNLGRKVERPAVYHTETQPSQSHQRPSRSGPAQSCPQRSRPSITAMNPVGIPHSRWVAADTLLFQTAPPRDPRRILPTTARRRVRNAARAPPAHSSTLPLLVASPQSRAQG